MRRLEAEGWKDGENGGEMEEEWKMEGWKIKRCKTEIRGKQQDGR